MTSTRLPSRSTASTRCSYPLVVAAKPPGNKPSILDNAGLPKTHDAAWPVRFGNERLVRIVIELQLRQLRHEREGMPSLIPKDGEGIDASGAERRNEAGAE